jgi:hypothetical protein
VVVVVVLLLLLLLLLLVLLLPIRRRCAWRKATTCWNCFGDVLKLIWIAEWSGSGK